MHAQVDVDDVVLDHEHSTMKSANDSEDPETGPEHSAAGEAFDDAPGGVDECSESNEKKGVGGDPPYGKTCEDGEAGDIDQCEDARCDSLEEAVREEDSLLEVGAHLSFVVGDRLLVPRTDGSPACTASVMLVKRGGGPTILVYDDMMWAGHPTEEIEQSLRDGVVRKVSEECDLPPAQRARAFLCPSNANGSPPDCFLFDEHILGDRACSWRWFGRLEPAPKDGTHNQRYSAPRIVSSLCTGKQVTLSGRVTRLYPSTRWEVKEVLSQSTHFTVLGFVQANLCAQKCFWILVTTAPDAVSKVNVYVATIFGKSSEKTHVNSLDEVKEVALNDYMPIIMVSK